MAVNRVVTRDRLYTSHLLKKVKKNNGAGNRIWRLIYSQTVRYPIIARRMIEEHHFWIYLWRPAESMISQKQGHYFQSILSIRRDCRKKQRATVIVCTGLIQVPTKYAYLVNFNFQEQPTKMICIKLWIRSLKQDFIKPNSRKLQKKSCECCVARGRVLQISYLLSCAGVWLGQHYYAIATVIIYKSH